jgi:hypothetical protein
MENEIKKNCISDLQAEIQTQKHLGRPVVSSSLKSNEVF